MDMNVESLSSIRTSRSAWRRIAGCFLIAASVLLAACGGGEPAQPSASPPASGDAPSATGGTLTIALEADFPSLDPLRLTNMAERQVALAIMDPLFDLDAQGGIKPVLATGYEILDEGRRYRIALRDGVRFHDGTPFDADAVVVNMERLRDPANTCRCLALLDNIESVAAVDPRTVEFVMKTPDAVLPAVLADTPGLMLSPKALAEAGEGIGQHPVGAGPFVLESWQSGHRIVVVRNDDYWQLELPYLDRVEFRPLANEESRQAALLAGDVDAIESPTPRFSAQYKDDPAYRLMTGAGLGSVFLMMNTRKPPFDDVRVRQAIAHATDRPLFVKALLQDQYPVADNLEGPGLWSYSPVPTYPQFDPERARALLAEIGTPVSFEFTVLNSPFMALTAQALQEMWAKVGIESTIRQVEGTRFIGEAVNHQFQLSLFRWAGRADPDLNFYRAFHSSFAERPSANYTQYANPAMDALLERGRATIDPAERKAIYADVSTLLARELPYYFLFHTTFQTMMRANVEPGPNIADGVLRLHTARRR